MLFFLSRNKIQHKLNAAKESSNVEREAVFEQVSNFIQEDFEALISLFDGLTGQSRISFDLLCALFVPGTLVYWFHPSTEQDMVLRVCQGFYEARDGKEYRYPDSIAPTFKISCEVISNNGKSFGFSYRYKLAVAGRYSGSREIQDLGAYPTEYHKDPEQLRQRLIAQGKRYAAFTGHSYNQISGMAMLEYGNQSYVSDICLLHFFVLNHSR